MPGEQRPVFGALLSVAPPSHSKCEALPLWRTLNTPRLTSSFYCAMASAQAIKIAVDALVAGRLAALQVHKRKSTLASQRLRWVRYGLAGRCAKQGCLGRFLHLDLFARRIETPLLAAGPLGPTRRPSCFCIIVEVAAFLGTQTTILVQECSLHRIHSAASHGTCNLYEPCPVLVGHK